MMSHKQVLQLVIAVILVISFLVGCGGSAPTAVSEAPAATSAPEQAVATSTPEPPTATPVPPTATPIPPTPTSTPEPPTATPEPLAISGKLLRSEGPMKNAQVILTHYQDEACVELAKSTTQRSASQEQQFKECKSELMTTADEQGQYKFSDIEPGWYSLQFTWVLVETPDQIGLMSLDIRDGFLTVIGESKKTPGWYIGIATQAAPFYYSGKENMVINFDYNKK